MIRGTSRQRRVLVVCGSGRYADPWHDHAATSHRVALLVQAMGHHVEVASTFAGSTPIKGVHDLVVVNSGRGTDEHRDDEWSVLHDSVQTHLARGGALLALHQAANTFADAPLWPGLIGGRWVVGTSFHPPQGLARFAAVADHPLTRGLPLVEADDERYCALEVEASSTVLYAHEHEGVTHPAVWVSGAATALYDGLGHGVESYDSDQRRRLLRREVTWLLDEVADRG